MCVFEPPFDKMLTVLTGEHWKHVRSLCTPTFTSGKLKRVMFISKKVNIRINITCMHISSSPTYLLSECFKMPIKCYQSTFWIITET